MMIATDLIDRCSGKAQSALAYLRSSESARVEFESEQGQAVYRLFSRLGRLESQGRPEYLGDRSDTTESLGDILLLAYQVPLQFESGPAVIKLNLAADGQNYFIHHFGIHSQIFAEE